MKTNSEILKELKEISAVLAAIPKVNCYKIPENYFINEFEQNAETAFVANKLNSLKTNAFVLPAALNSNTIFDGVETALILENFPTIKNCFVTPKNYFEQLTAKMTFAVGNQKMVHNLPSFDNAIFKVPNNYFADLEQSLMLAINDNNLENESLNLPKESFAVPANYFNNLSENILATVKNEEEEKLNPLFEQMRSEKVFLTPNNYFENLTENILNN